MESIYGVCACSRLPSDNNDIEPFKSPLDPDTMTGATRSFEVDFGSESVCQEGRCTTEAGYLRRRELIF